MNRIVCMKWGTKFPVDYVNVLYAAVKRNMRRPFEFICFTDDPTGLAKGITARELPSLGPVSYTHLTLPTIYSV